MYVCVCRAVTEKHIENAVLSGARKLRDLREQLGVTEECGRCAKCARQCLEGAMGQVCGGPQRNLGAADLLVLPQAA